jgi:hypothetical protein
MREKTKRRDTGKEIMESSREENRITRIRKESRGNVFHVISV